MIGGNGIFFKTESTNHRPAAAAKTESTTTLACPEGGSGSASQNQNTAIPANTSCKVSPMKRPILCPFTFNQMSSATMESVSSCSQYNRKIKLPAMAKRMEPEVPVYRQNLIDLRLSLGEGSLSADTRIRTASRQLAGPSADRKGESFAARLRQENSRRRQDGGRRHRHFNRIGQRRAGAALAGFASCPGRPAKMETPSKKVIPARESLMYKAFFRAKK